MRAARGCTDFNAAMAYKLLTPEQQQIANHSTVTYAPHALFVLFFLRRVSSPYLLSLPTPSLPFSGPHCVVLQLLDRLY